MYTGLFQLAASIPILSVLLWCVMEREEYNEKRSRSRFDWSSEQSCRVALGRSALVCVRGSACSHNNRLIEVIIWQPRIALNEERIEEVVYLQKQVFVCDADVFLRLCLINYTNSHAFTALWVNTDHTAKVMMRHILVCASAHWAISNPRLTRGCIFSVVYYKRCRLSGFNGLCGV